MKQLSQISVLIFEEHRLQLFHEFSWIRHHIACIAAPSIHKWPGHQHLVQGDREWNDSNFTTASAPLWELSVLQGQTVLWFCLNTDDISEIWSQRHKGCHWWNIRFPVLRFFRSSHHGLTAALWHYAPISPCLTRHLCCAPQLVSSMTLVPQKTFTDSFHFSICNYRLLTAIINWNTTTPLNRIFCFEYTLWLCHITAYLLDTFQ